MIKRLILLLLLHSVTSVFGQQQHMLFTKVWGPSASDHYSSISFADQLSNGDYILIGMTTVNQSGQFWYYASRIDSTGSILWEQLWSGPGDKIRVNSVIKSYDGSYIVVGSSGSVGGILTVSNLDQDGNVNYCRNYLFGFDDSGFGITTTSDSCYVISGVRNMGASSQCPVLLKIDPQGNEIWRRVQSSLVDHLAYRVRATADSGFIVAGWAGNYSNCFYEKLDVNGNFQWINYPFGLGDTIYNSIGDLRVNENGTFDIFYKVDFFEVNPGIPHKGLLRQYTAMGDTIWTKYYSEEVESIFLNHNDSLFYGVSSQMSLLKMEFDYEFSTLVTNGVRYLYGFISTQDSGYLGFGMQENWSILNTRFEIMKFAPDGRSEPLSFLGNIDLYPNPCLEVNPVVSFDVQTDENVQVTVVSMDGRLMYFDEIFCPAQSHTELPIYFSGGTTTAGVYIVEIRTSREYRREMLIIGRPRPD